MVKGFFFFFTYKKLKSVVCISIRHYYQQFMGVSLVVCYFHILCKLKFSRINKL